MSTRRASSASPATSLRETVTNADVQAVREIVASTGFFYDHEIAVAVELAQEALDKGAEASGYHFLFVDPAGAPGRAIAYACFGPIACTVGSWDLYWIAAHSDHRGKGLGRILLHAAEARIAALSGRRVYIETSSRPLYAPTRGFYLACGYAEEARLAEFYGPGDDKIIYSRALSSPSR